MKIIFLKNYLAEVTDTDKQTCEELSSTLVENSSMDESVETNHADNVASSTDQSIGRQIKRRNKFDRTKCRYCKKADKKFDHPMFVSMLYSFIFYCSFHCI